MPSAWGRPIHCTTNPGAAIRQAALLKYVELAPLHIPNDVAPQPLHAARLRHATVERLDGPAGADVHLLSTSEG